MKRNHLIQIICLLFGICILMSACGNKITSIESPQSTDEPVRQQNTEQKESQTGPSEDLLREDLQNIFYSLPNLSFLSLDSFEVLQSLTEERSYSATINATAHSQYAEFQINADVSYTKFDQGWAIDNGWGCGVEDYQVVNYPSEETISALIEAGEEYGSPRGERTFIGMTQNSDHTVTYKSYIAERMGNHVSQSVSITSVWSYNYQTDGWEKTSAEYEYSQPKLTDVEGEWPSAAGGTIIISNVTENGFDVCNTYCESGTVHVTYDPEYDAYVGTGASYHVPRFMSQTDLPIFVEFSYSEDTGNNIVTVTIRANSVDVDWASIP